MLEAVDVYDAAASATFSRVCIENPQVQLFSRDVTSLLRRLADDVADEYWAVVMRRLRRARWELATTPLPINHAALELVDSAKFVAHALRACDRIYPAHTAAASAVSRQLAELATTVVDPLGDAIRKLLSCEPVDYETGESAAPAIVLPRARHVGAVEDQFSSAGFPVTVVTPAQLARPRVYGRAIVVGAVAWYPSYVVAAPRASRIDVVQYGWIRDSTPETSLFAGSEDRAPSLPPLERPAEVGVGNVSPQAEPDELMPPTDWAAINAGATRGEPESPDHVDTVEAFLLLLASDEAVYLEVEEGSRAYVVTLGAEKELRQVPTRSIDPGTYLVTREDGEGDYIPAIADSLLGWRARELRAAQRRWKSLLQELIGRFGLRAVVRRLEEAGSLRATEMNARRWASDTSIRTQDYQDFRAIMSVIGLEMEVEDLWNQMAMIDQAHLRAGQHVRALLEREILAADTRMLERRGWMDCDVAEIEGEGALRVARVEARALETFVVPVRRTRRPFAVGRDLWQG